MCALVLGGVCQHSLSAESEAGGISGIPQSSRVTELWTGLKRLAAGGGRVRQARASSAPHAEQHDTEQGQCRRQHIAHSVLIKGKISAMTQEYLNAFSKCFCCDVSLIVFNAFIIEKSP